MACQFDNFSKTHSFPGIKYWSCAFLCSSCQFPYFFSLFPWVWLLQTWREGHFHHIGASFEHRLVSKGSSNFVFLPFIRYGCSTWPSFSCWKQPLLWTLTHRTHPLVIPPTSSLLSQTSLLSCTLAFPSRRLCFPHFKMRRGKRWMSWRSKHWCEMLTLDPLHFYW